MFLFLISLRQNEALNEPKKRLHGKLFMGLLKKMMNNVKQLGETIFLLLLTKPTLF